MTISIPVTQQDLVSSSIVDGTAVFNNTNHIPYPAGQLFKENNMLYKNVLDAYYPPVFSAQGVYTINQIVYKDGLIQKINQTGGLVAKEPEEYVSVETSFDNTLWTQRYMKLLDIPANVSTFGVSVSNVGGVSKWTAAGPTVRFSSNGLKMFVTSGAQADTKIYQYDLITAWALETATYSGISLAIPQVTYVHKNFIFSPDGTKIFITSEYDANRIIQYTLSTAWNIATATFTKSLPLFSGSSTVDCLSFNADGTKIIFYEGDVFRLRSFNLVTPYTLVGVADYPTQVTGQDLSLLSVAPNDMQFNATGTKLWVSGVNGGNGQIVELTLATAWNIGSLSRSGNQVGLGTVLSFYFNATGTKLYTIQPDAVIKQHTLSTVYDITTAKYSVLPFTKTETRGGSTYSYTLSYSNGVYTFSTLVNGVASSTSVTKYDNLTLNTLENSAVIGSNGTWLAKTMIIRPLAIYIRTTIDTSIETKTITAYLLNTVTSPSQLTGFANMGATSQYLPLDGKNYTKVESTTGSMIYNISTPNKFDTISLGNVKADHINIVFKNAVGDVVATVDKPIETTRDLLGNLPSWVTTLVFYSSATGNVNDAIVIDGGSVQITLTSASPIELATLLIGISARAGFTGLELKNEYKDFSTFEYDTFGNVDYVEKAKVSLYSGTVYVPITDYDRTDRLMTSLGQNLMIVNGSDWASCGCDSESIFAATQKIGRFRSFSQSTRIKENDMDKLAQYSFTLEEIV